MKQEHNFDKPNGTFTLNLAVDRTRCHNKKGM